MATAFIFGMAAIVALAFGFAVVAGPVVGKPCRYWQGRKRKDGPLA